MKADCQEQKEKLSAVSVVIPTLNVATLLPPLLAALAAEAVGEVILADGGSADGVAFLPARLIKTDPGRGGQLAAGGTAATGDWLLFLHADTRLEAGWAAALRTAMNHPGRAAYFRFALDDDSQPARRLEAMVAWRCRWLALPYGDQGLFISRALYESLGGFRPIPLMEDVELIRRIGRARLAALDIRAVTSAERWRRDGWWGRSARNVTILTLWFCGLSPQRLAKIYQWSAPAKK